MMLWMPADRLRLMSFLVYLASWLVLAVLGLAGIARRQRVEVRLTIPVISGTLLQVAGALLLTLTMGNGPLHPSRAELAGALILAPLGAAVFAWAFRSVPPGGASLATTGAYARLRHPVYLAFLAMLGATGLLLSAGSRLLVAGGLYLAGTELRIADEEADLQEKFPEAYGQYRRRTRWRYLPGLR